MDALILALMLGFASILIILGFTFKHIALLAFSGIAFILSGLFVWNGVYYQTGFVGNVTGNVTTTVYSYSKYMNSFVTPLGILLSLFGVFLILVSAISIFSPESLNVFDGGLNEDE